MRDTIVFDFVLRLPRALILMDILRRQWNDMFCNLFQRWIPSGELIDLICKLVISTGLKNLMLNLSTNEAKSQPVRDALSRTIDQFYLQLVFCYALIHLMLRSASLVSAERQLSWLKCFYGKVTEND